MLNPIESARLAVAALRYLDEAELRTLWPDKHGLDLHGRDPGAGGLSSPLPAAKKAPEATQDVQAGVQGYTPTPNKWPEGLKKLSGPKGSNPGGQFQAADGSKWYVKEYADPRQGASERISSEIYRKLGLLAPETVLGEGNKFASKWMEVQGTVGKLGLTKERADEILDGFAADVLTMNWDAVGTGLDNAVVTGGGRIARVDQGGTLLFRAQGALKPEALLDKIGEWDTIPSPTQNHYYAGVFAKAGVKDGNALGERAAKQIDRIVAAKGTGSWRQFIDQTVPNAGEDFKKRVAVMLDKRTALLEEKAKQLRTKTLGDWDEALHPRDSAGKFTQATSGPMAGEAPGQHTPAAQARVIAYLEQETGNKFKPHGSVSRGRTSTNDIDIALVEPSEEKIQQLQDEANQFESDLHDRRARGEITEQEMMEALYGEGVSPNSVEGALARIGFVPSHGASWLGIDTIAYKNDKTGHVIEIWQQGDAGFYGLAGWNEAQHPRDKEGQFTEADGYDGTSKQGEEALKAVYKDEGAMDLLASSAVFTFHDDDREAANLWETGGWGDAAEEHWIDPRYVGSIQEDLERSRVAEYIRNGPAAIGYPGRTDDMPEMLQMPDGTMYVVDGHHRTAAAILSGATRLKARVHKAALVAQARGLAATYWNPEEHPRDKDGKFARASWRWKKGEKRGSGLGGAPLVPVDGPSPNGLNPGIYEPSFPELRKWEHASAGVVVVEPDGRVWLAEPKGKFGGYRATFPKGTVDEGETLQQTALRELWEETGLQARIVSHLVDVRRTTSVARFYMAERIGGAPWTFEKETHAVRLMPTDGDAIHGALRNTARRTTSDHVVLQALRGRLHPAPRLPAFSKPRAAVARLLASFRALWPDKTGYDDHGRGDAVAREEAIQFSPEQTDWEASLMGNEVEAIESYVGPEGRSEYINRSLRNPDAALPSESIRRAIENLDSALARAKHTEEQILYRGINSPSLLARLKPGAEFIDKAFVSTTLDPAHAKVFTAGIGTAGANSKSAVLRIRTNKGAYISNVAGPVMLDGEVLNEREWLLPRGLRYRVESVEEKDDVRVFNVRIAA